MRLVSVAPRSAPWIAPSISRISARIVRQPFPQQFEIAEDGHQQIVEVVRDAAGELAEALHLLHLMHLRQRRLAFAGALLDALFQLARWPAASSAVRSSTRRSSSAFSSSSWRVLRYRSANTRTFARSSSGTTGTGT